MTAATTTGGPEQAAEAVEASVIRNGRWLLGTRFVLRMTGFPAELVDELRMPRTVAALGGQRSAETDAAAEAVFAEEVAECVTRLKSIAARSDFREAVLLSNQAGFPSIAGWIAGHKRQPAKERHAALTVALYLQRFCTKNDTASFFGPFHWGRIDAAAPETLIELPDGSPRLHRRTFFTHWCARDLANCLVGPDNDPDIVRPRRVPTVVLLRGQAVGVRLVQPWWEKVTTPMPVSQAAQQLYELVDGDRTVADLRRLAEADGLTVADVAAALKELLDAGTITAALEVPLGIEQPIEFLIDTLNGAGAESSAMEPQHRSRSVAQLSDLVSLQNRFDRSPVDDRYAILEEIGKRFTNITASAATRGAGKLYADRSVLYEDATREFTHCQLGADMVGELGRYGPLWDLLWLPTERDFQLTNEATAAWFGRRFSGEAEVAFLDYARAWVDDRAYLTEMLEDCAKQLEPHNEALLQDLCRGQSAADTVHLTIDEVARILQRHGGAGHDGVVLNPDVLLATDSQHALRRGEYQLVLGEIHSDRDLLSHGLFTSFLRGIDRDLVAEFASTGYRLASDDVVADVVRTHERKTNVQVELDLPSVEMQHRGRGDRSRLVSAADLAVRLDGGRLRLRDTRNDRFLRLTVARVPVGSAERSSPLRPFAFPRRDFVLPIPAETRYFPRIEVERMVIQRRLWRTSPLDWGPEPATSGWSADHFRWLRAGARQAQIPVRAFAKVAGERKGTFVDFDSYLLVRALLRIWKRNPGSITFTELLPDRSQWWLSDSRGSYSCEFRLGMFRTVESPVAIGSR